MEVAVLFIAFATLMLIGIPIGYSIAMSTLVVLLAFTDLPMALITQNAITGVDSFPLMAIPFFILAGSLMSTGGVARRIVNFANVCLGMVTGGLGFVTTAACMFFAAISGSAVATTSAIGATMIPEMEKHGYDRGFSASLTAAAGSIGVIIPPSIPFVIYGVCVNVSIGELFIAGLIPGILMGIALMIACYIMSKRHGYTGTGHVPTGREVWASFKDAFWALLTPVIILGGIYTGIFTPTEASVIACVYAIIVSSLIYREFRLRDLYKALRDAMEVNGLTTFMVGFSMAFAAYLTLEQVPGQIAIALMELSDSKIVLLLLINVFLLIVGCLVDNIPATIILSPILLPVVVDLGMSPVTFGVMLTMNLAIGFCTPPYGIDLFVASAISGVPMEKMMRTMWWFILALICVLMVTTFCPFITQGMVNLIK